MKCFLGGVASLTLLVCGCSGGGADQVPVYPVSGKVTLGGGPVAKATVVFSPVDGQPVATGMTDTQGEFKLTTYDSFDGAAEGNYEVLISKSAAPAASTGGAPSHDPTGSSTQNSAPSHSAGNAESGGAVIDPKWSQHGNGLSAEVKKGEDNVFELTLN